MIGPDAARWLTGAAGSWLVHLRIGYHDALGQFVTTYDQWVPSHANLPAWQTDILLAPVGTTCIVE